MRGLVGRCEREGATCLRLRVSALHRASGAMPYEGMCLCEEHGLPLCHPLMP